MAKVVVPKEYTFEEYIKCAEICLESFKNSENKEVVFVDFAQAYFDQAKKILKEK